MAQIVLRNTERQTFMVTEYHEVVCRRRNACKCKVTRVTSPRGKAVSRKDPRSFHIFGLSDSRPLDMEVLYLPEVRAALKSGWLKKVGADAPKVAETKPAAKPPKGGKAASAASASTAKGGK